MTELFKNVKPGQRCLFYMRNKGQSDTMLRANFIKIIHNRTVLLNNVECEHCGILVTPLEYIVKIETLDDITHNQLLIPSEIMLEIDLFV